MTFEEVGADQESEQDLGRPAKACGNPCMGTITFSPALGYGGTRNVQASLTRNGLPLDRQTFASYVAPDVKPGKVSRLHLKRKKIGLAVCWKAAPPRPSTRWPGSRWSGRARPVRRATRRWVPQEPLRDVPRRQGRGAAAARVRHRS